MMNLEGYKRQLSKLQDEAIHIRNEVPATPLHKSNDLDQRIRTQLAALDQLKDEISRNRNLAERQITVLKDEINRLHGFLETSANNVTLLKSGEPAREYPLGTEHQIALDQVTRMLGQLERECENVVGEVFQEATSLLSRAVRLDEVVEYNIDLAKMSYTLDWLKDTINRTELLSPVKKEQLKDRLMFNVVLTSNKFDQQKAKSEAMQGLKARLCKNGRGMLLLSELQKAPAVVAAVAEEKPSETKGTCVLV